MITTITLLVMMYFYISGDNELYIAGGDSFGSSVYSMYKWCAEDNLFEDMAGLHTSRKQYVQ